MLDKIMQKLGYENIENIKILEKFEQKTPRATKLLSKLFFYAENKVFEQPIVLDQRNCLRDGYTTYIIAQQLGKKYIKVVRKYYVV